MIVFTFITLWYIVMCASYPYPASDGIYDSYGYKVHDYTVFGDQRYPHRNNCGHHGAHGYLHRRHDYHNRHHESPFYFYKHGHAHFYPPIAVLGG